MAKEKKTENIVTPNDIGWTDHVLELLSDDEKIKGNPTTDGLRRIFEIAMDCVVTESTSEVCQSPDPNNGNRATVVHSLTYVLNNCSPDSPINTRTVNGAADVYWGNCDKIFRNHPVAVAETRAEGRALRRGLKLRKVVAAEELAEEIEDDIDASSVGKISNNQINFMDVLSKRLDINMQSMAEEMGLDKDNIRSLTHSSAVDIIRKLSGYQQNIDDIPEFIKGYNEEWR
jgi:hypothetical protein